MSNMFRIRVIYDAYALLTIQTARMLFVFGSAQTYWSQCRPDLYSYAKLVGHDIFRKLRQKWTPCSFPSQLKQGKGHMTMTPNLRILESNASPPSFPSLSVLLKGVPVTRAAHRREPKSWFRPLKSPFRNSIKLSSMYHCTTAISPLGQQFAMRSSAILVKLSIVSLAPSITALVNPPW